VSLQPHADQPTEFRVLSWNVRRGLRRSDSHASDADWLSQQTAQARPHALLLQEWTATSPIPLGWVVPKKVLDLYHEHHDGYPPTVVAIREDLLDFVIDQAVHSIPYEGSFCRLSLLVHQGMMHLYSVHAPVHPASPPDDTFEEWAQLLFSDLDSAKSQLDPVFLGGDWNFAWDSNHGYFPSRADEAQWQAVDQSRRELLEASAFSGPSTVQLTHTSKGGRRSQFDYILTRQPAEDSAAPTRDYKVLSAEGRASDHQVIVTELALDPAPDNSAHLVPRTRLPRRGDKKYNECLSALNWAICNSGTTDLATMHDTMEKAVSSFARKSAPRSRQAIHIEIHNLRRWAVIGEELSALAGTAQGRSNLALMENNPAVQALRHWLSASARSATWGALASQLRATAQELQVVVNRHDAATEKKQYAMYYADSDWQFRSMARRLGRPTPRAVNKVVVEGVTFTDPHTVKRELDKWARKTNTSVYNDAQLAMAQAEYDGWLDKADIHVAPNQAAVDRPSQCWVIPRFHYPD
jgi:hypothetical protein